MFTVIAKGWTLGLHEHDSFLPIIKKDCEILTSWLSGKFCSKKKPKPQKNWDFGL
jgi:hypothetical protein